MIAGDVTGLGVVVLGDRQKIQARHVSCVLVGLGRRPAAVAQGRMAMKIAEENRDLGLSCRPHRAQHSEQTNGERKATELHFDPLFNNHR